jgi:hypothetical protein
VTDVRLPLRYQWLRAVTLAAIAIVFVLLASASPRGAGADAGPTVTASVQNNFPDGMTFSVHAEGPAQITKLRLHYKILPDGTDAIAQPVFTPSTSVDGNSLIGGSKLYLPPGTVVDYHWEATDAAGNTGQTAPQSPFYNDIRFNWQEVTGDGLTVYYYSGSSDDATTMHGVAVKAIADAEALMGASVPFEVQVWVYDNQDDMRPALQKTSPSFDSQIITLGVKVASNTVLVLGNVSFDTLRHELTHIVTGRAGDSALGSLPVWLDEGTAVHAQQDQGGYRAAIEQALSSGNVLSVREITAYPGDASKIELFYGEGWSLVSFLVDTYGQTKFAQLYAGIKSGKGVDKAFQAVYGFDQDGLDNAWRVAHGLSPLPTPAPTTPALSPTPIVALATGSSSSGGTSTGTIIAIVAAVLVLALVVGAGGIALARRL